ncbi:MAG: MCP four helix bundle domain-containing protein [Bacteroidales bacterium]|nr:MCP four helix bundle domain-containing protein [Bacteroidales bacterium]MCF8327968.1 MCP four helix bundle domain-containing protein [Bacteroidales bacterium]
MKKTLRLKIFASFFLLIAMLAIAGTISVLEFRWLTNSVHGLIHDNYKSIEASKSMIEALEREDSGVLLLLLGEWEEGRNIIKSADKEFDKSFKIAKNNLTEKNEGQYIKSIEERYNRYKEQWKRPIVGTAKQGDMEWYRNDIHKLFLDTKEAVNDLMTINQKSMYKEASHLEEKSKRAIMPGIVAIIAALVFSVILNFFITRYFVRPISELTEAVNKVHEDQHILNINISSKDEIKDLEIAIKKLIQRLLRNSKHAK